MVVPNESNLTEFQTIDTNLVHGIKTRQYVNFGIDTFATVMAIMMILWKSPKEMRTYKWFLLNIVFWSYLMDVNLTVIYVPLSLFPAPVMCILGLADRIENYFYANSLVFFLLVEFLGACGAAIVCALYYRYRSVTGQSMEIFSQKSAIVGMLIFHLANGLPCLIALSMAAEQSVPTIVKYLHETFPTAPDVYWLKCGAINANLRSAKVFMMLAACEILMYVIIVLFGSVYVYVCHRRRTTESSTKIRSLERQWIIALVVQATIPFITLVCPYVFMALSILFRFKNVVYVTSILFEISSLHAFLNAMAMFFTVKSYRDAIFNLLTCRRYNRVEGYEKHSTQVIMVKQRILY